MDEPLPSTQLIELNCGYGRRHRSRSGRGMVDVGIQNLPGVVFSPIGAQLCSIDPNFHTP